MNKMCSFFILTSVTAASLWLWNPVLRTILKLHLDWEQQSSMIDWRCLTWAQEKEVVKCLPCVWHSWFRQNIPLKLELLKKRWASGLHSNLGSKNKKLYDSVQINISELYSSVKWKYYLKQLLPHLMPVGPDWRKVLMTDLELLAQGSCRIPVSEQRRSRRILQTHPLFGSIAAGTSSWKQCLFISSQFCGSEVQQYWVLCSGSHNAEIKVLPKLDGLLPGHYGKESTFKLIRIVKIQFLLVVGLRFSFPCWLQLWSALCS